jgi:hypothetical protein
MREEPKISIEETNVLVVSAVDPVVLNTYIKIVLYAVTISRIRNL